MADVKYSPLALRDLEQIGDYIAEELKNPIAAINTVNRIQDATLKLADFPERGALLSARYGDAGDTRYLVCGSYIYYKAIKGGKRK